MHQRAISCGLHARSCDCTVFAKSFVLNLDADRRRLRDAAHRLGHDVFCWCWHRAPSPAAGSTKESRRRQRKRQLKHSAPATHISNHDQNIAEERHAVEQNLSLTAITAGQFKFNCVLVLRFGGKKSLLTHHRSTNSRTFGRSRSPGVSAARPMYKNPAMRSCSASFIALLTAGL